MMQSEHDYTKLKKSELEEHIKLAAAGAPWIKNSYDIGEITSYKDVPGWINDAIWIFKEVVEKSSDGDILLEIGTYFGQSACYMGELIKNSKKQLRFDTFDIFELDASMRAGYHPRQFVNYRFSENLTTCPMHDLVNTHFKLCQVTNYVNSIICDAKYTHKLYQDNSLMLVYTDGINDKIELYTFLKSMWPKIKAGGILAGDDIFFDQVREAVKIFCEEMNIQWDDVQKTDLSWVIRK